MPVPFDVVQHEHRSSAVRTKQMDLSMDLQAAIAQLPHGRRHFEHRLAVRQKPLARRAERPEALDDHVDGEPVEPGRERRLAAKQRELLPRPDEDVLRQFLGRVGAGHPPREIENPRHVRLVYPLESRRIPLTRKDNVVHQQDFG